MEKSTAKVTSEDIADGEVAGIKNDGYTTGSANGEPKCKVARLSKEANIIADLTLNHSYTTPSFTEQLKAEWCSQEKQDFHDTATDVKVFRDPFQVCLLPDLLQNKITCRQLVDEMVQKVQWSRKQMDLYEFYQSADLSNMATCKLLTSFLQMLRRTVRPWLEALTGLKLDYVSASCSMYTCGDYLLVHDDLLKDRQIAFIYYLSPWENMEQWREEQGGCLELFNSDDHCFPLFPVKRKISPKNNQFAFFKVGSRSFHQVGEVTSFDYPRLTINGWFHGASNDDLISDIMRPFGKQEFTSPVNKLSINISELLNEVYLKAQTKKSIQKRIEDNSEICLYEFLRREIFEQALDQLLHDDTLKWRLEGPANAHNYEVLELDTASKSISHLISLFSSTEIFALLRDYTDLDLAGPNAINPTYNLQIQRWSHGNYTVLGDGAICEENTLDLIYYLNASEGAAIVTYLSPEADEPLQKQRNEDSDIDDIDFDEEDDDSVLLTITPVDNALNIVYRCEGTTKFTKYVSRNTPLERGPVHVISCSYKE
ncbi:PREDICTED: prolyl 3-hydroxylase sudestada1 isoform X1 [Bactrocera latifrons]|uniref:uS12 prolyl 3-hydroxylase n=1 Tax=Bactrocera latifrons TaxID=174628 RepID=A0A0K8UY84_BACLA|nr:PREDICTED: prolyl 3-hydroxylase sudestada1 isoform X1 [Bactrocera latifrons]